MAEQLTLRWVFLGWKGFFFSRLGFPYLSKGIRDYTFLKHSNSVFFKFSINQIIIKGLLSMGLDQKKWIALKGNVFMLSKPTNTKNETYLCDWNIF